LFAERKILSFTGYFVSHNSFYCIKKKKKGLMVLTHGATDIKYVACFDRNNKKKRVKLLIKAAQNKLV